MRVVIAAALCLATAVPSLGAEAGCLDLVTLNGWSAVPYESKGSTMIWLGLRNEGDADIVMIEGTATFVDALGNTVEPFPMALSPDINLPAKAQEISELYPPGVSRLTSIDASLVKASVCVTGAVTRDGRTIRVNG